MVAAGVPLDRPPRHRSRPAGGSDARPRRRMGPVTAVLPGEGGRDIAVALGRARAVRRVSSSAARRQRRRARVTCSPPRPAAPGRPGPARSSTDGVRTSAHPAIATAGTARHRVAQSRPRQHREQDRRDERSRRLVGLRRVGQVRGEGPPRPRPEVRGRPRGVERQALSAAAEDHRELAAAKQDEERQGSRWGHRPTGASRRVATSARAASADDGERQLQPALAGSNSASGLPY